MFKNCHEYCFNEAIWKDISALLHLVTICLYIGLSAIQCETIRWLSYETVNQLISTGINGLPTTRPLPNTICLHWYMQFHCHSPVIIIVDGLNPILRKGICNHHDYANKLENIRTALTAYFFPEIPAHRHCLADIPVAMIVILGQ